MPRTLIDLAPPEVQFNDPSLTSNGIWEAARAIATAPVSLAQLRMQQQRANLENQQTQTQIAGEQQRQSFATDTHPLQMQALGQENVGRAQGLQFAKELHPGQVTGQTLGNRKLSQEIDQSGQMFVPGLQLRQAQAEEASNAADVSDVTKADKIAQSRTAAQTAAEHLRHTQAIDPSLERAAAVTAPYGGAAAAGRSWSSLLRMVPAHETRYTNQLNGETATALPAGADARFWKAATISVPPEERMRRIEMLAGQGAGVPGLMVPPGRSFPSVQEASPVPMGEATIPAGSVGVAQMAPTVSSSSTPQPDADGLIPLGASGWRVTPQQLQTLLTDPPERAQMLNLWKTRHTPGELQLLKAELKARGVR